MGQAAPRTVGSSLALLSVLLRRLVEGRLCFSVAPRGLALPSPPVSHPLTSLRPLQVPDCCPGFFGTMCEPCPGGLGGVCSGHGQCQDRLLGSGECRCREGFHGTACEMCELGRYGPNCTGGEPGGRAGEVETPLGAAGTGRAPADACHPPLPVLLPVCDCAHGLCQEGLRGDGSCVCNVGWQGLRCNQSEEWRPGERGESWGGGSGVRVVRPSSSYPPRNQWP